MRKKTDLPSLAVFLILCGLVLPVAAALQEVTVKGTVSTIHQPKNTLSVDNPLRHECEYPAAGGPVCSWKPMNTSSLTGSVPDVSAFAVFRLGDTIITRSIGGAGETWIPLAKLYWPKPDEEYVTDVVGDHGSLPPPLAGDYAVETSTLPDFWQCNVTTCAAKSADVRIKSSGAVYGSGKEPASWESFTYNGRNDASSVTVTFVKWQASSGSCPGMGAVSGLQVVSVFTVHVLPQIGFGQKDIRTATTTRPEEAPPGADTGGTGPFRCLTARHCRPACHDRPICTNAVCGDGALGVLWPVLRKR